MRYFSVHLYIARENSRASFQLIEDIAAHCARETMHVRTQCCATCATSMPNASGAHDRTCVHGRSAHVHDMMQRRGELGAAPHEVPEPDTRRNKTDGPSQRAFRLQESFRCVRVSGWKKSQSQAHPICQRLRSISYGLAQAPDFSWIRHLPLQPGPKQTEGWRLRSQHPTKLQSAPQHRC